MLEQVGQVGHDLREGAGLLADANHADVKFAEQPGMFLQRGGKRRALADRIGNARAPLRFKRRIFLLLAQASKACGMGMAAPSSAPISRVNAVISFRLIRVPNRMLASHGRTRRPMAFRWRRGSAASPRERDFEVRTGNSPRWPSSRSAALRSSASITPLTGRAAGLDRLVAERAHSSTSPEETRRISSSDVMPAAAFCKRILVHRHHGFLGGAFELGVRPFLENQFPQLGIDRQQFKNADAAAITGAAAFLTSFAAIKRALQRAGRPGPPASPASSAATGDFRPAMRTDSPDQPLRQHPLQRRRNQEGFDAHVHAAASRRRWNRSCAAC